MHLKLVSPASHQQKHPSWCLREGEAHSMLDPTNQISVHCRSRGNYIYIKTLLCRRAKKKEERKWWSHAACKEQKSMTWDKIEWHNHCSLHAVTSSVIYYSTHAQKNVIYLFYTIKMVYRRILRAWKRKNKSADVIWRHLHRIEINL